MQDTKARRPRRKQPSKPKVCRFCEAKANYVDFKDAAVLSQFQTEKGKIMPRRITGTCPDHQKMLCEAIKRARILSLVY